MTPKALSLEPVILFSTLLFLFVVLPVVFLFELKARLRIRATLVIGILVLAVFLSFRLGLASGRSMAWYHWRSEYQDPLRELQLLQRDLLEEGKTQAVYQVALEFSKENVEAYGQEPLFKKGKFSQFVERIERVR
jgi:hypothetical protein